MCQKKDVKNSVKKVFFKKKKVDEIQCRVKCCIIKTTSPHPHRLLIKVVFFRRINSRKQKIIRKVHQIKKEKCDLKKTNML